MEEDKIIIITSKISKEKLKKIAKNRFGDFIKAVVDLDKKIMAIGGELHADEEAILLENGSAQSNLWGINLYPDLPLEQWIEFDSMINIRPSQGNRSRGVENEEIRKLVIDVVNLLTE